MGHQLRGHSKGGLTVREPDLDVLIADTVPQDIDRPSLVELLGQPLDELLVGQLFVAAVGLDQFLQRRALRFFDEPQELYGVETETRVEARSPLRLCPNLALLIAARGSQVRADLVLQQLLADGTHAASGMSS